MRRIFGRIIETLMDFVKSHVQDIEKDLLWLENLIQYQLGKASEELIHHIENEGGISPPIFGDIGFYGQNLALWKPTAIERGLLIIGAALYFKPHVFDPLIKAAKDFNFTETRIGGIIGTAQSPFLPTGETAIFLLTNGSVQERMQVLHCLTQEHWLFAKAILVFDYKEPNLPLSFQPFSLSSDYMEIFSKGVATKPNYSSQFPASLVNTNMEWSDLVISKELIREIRDIELWLEYEETLFGEMDLGHKIKEGYKVVFYGPSGTGKTLVAGLIGKKYNRDVYRIDLSQLSSKYIGETEKNIGNLFKQARNKNWILFFDEGESLFGKRTQSGQSNERYGNQQVGFLLQQMEDHPGVLILATNLKSTIDEAFLRRFQKMIYFEAPDFEYRFDLWKKALNGTLPLADDIDLRVVAKEYKLVGGQIVNIVKQIILRELGANSEVIRLKTLEEAIAEEERKN